MRWASALLICMDESDALKHAAMVTEVIILELMSLTTSKLSQISISITKEGEKEDSPQKYVLEHMSSQDINV